MAPTYSEGNCSDNVGAKEGVTFSHGTASLNKTTGISKISTVAAESAKVDIMEIPTNQQAKSSSTSTPTPVPKAVEFPAYEELLEKASRYKKSSRKVILLSRHGESENNFSGKIGGDTNLSPRGRAYAAALANYVNSMELQCPVEVWTSGLKRTIATAAGVKCNQRKAMKELNELHAGCCEGMSYEEIQSKYPLEFAMRDQDKLGYKYPNGESYQDVLARVGPVIEKIEKDIEEEIEQENEDKVLLIVSHQAVIRCFLTHFLNIPAQECPYLDVPLHTVLWLMQDEDTGKWSVSYVKLPVECVDTFRPKPRNCNLRRSESEALETVPTHY